MAELAIPKGSTILVSGSNGYIGSHIVDKVLEAGYKVRGTVRAQEKADWCREVFHKKYGKDSYEAVVVEDMAAEGSFDEVIQGCAGAIHVASDLTFRPDPTIVIPPVIKGTTNILHAAAKNRSIKRVVLTSSSAAAVLPTPNKEFKVDESSWNTEAVEIAHRPPPYEAERAFAVYSASKTEGELACWDFMSDHKPGFVFNAVLPNFNLGVFLHEKQPGSSSAMMRQMFEGNETAIDFLRNFDPQYFVDVQDVARLHLAALIYPDVADARLLAFAEPFNFNKSLQLMKKIDPNKSLPDEVEGLGQDLSIIDTTRSVELLKRMGRDGFTSMEQSMRDCLSSAKSETALNSTMKMT